MENIRSKMDKQSFKKLLLTIIVAVLVIGVIVGAIVILANAYNSRLHGNFAKATSVYGQNGFTGEKYELAEESQNEIKSQLAGLRKVQKTIPNIYQTYIVVQMNDKTSYLLKYESDISVQVIKMETDKDGNVSYSDAIEFSSEGSLSGLCKALEVDHGMGYVLKEKEN